MKKTNQLEEAMRAKIGPLKASKPRASLFDANPPQHTTTAPEVVEKKAGAVAAKSKKAQAISYKNNSPQEGEKIGAVATEQADRGAEKIRHNFMISPDLFMEIKVLEAKIKYNRKSSGVNINTLMESIIKAALSLAGPAIDTGSVTDPARFEQVFKSAINQGRGEA